MRYHWEFISDGQTALYEEGKTFNGTLPSAGVVAAINRLGPYLGRPEPSFKVTGSLVQEALDFATLEEAMLAVEGIVAENGGTIEGR